MLQRDQEKLQSALIAINDIWEFTYCLQQCALDVKVLNILWQIVPESQGIIEVYKKAAEENQLHYLRRDIEVGVEVAQFSIEDKGAQSLRQ